MKRRVFCALFALMMLLSACSQGASAWQGQYDLGVRYLSEGKYQEAIIAFNAAIEIDPKQADAYLGLADAYEAMGDVEQARRVLTDALTVVNDPSAIQSQLDGLEGSAATEPTPGTTVEPTPGTTVETAQEEELTPTSSSTVIASGDCGENLTWTLGSDGLLTISGTGTMTNYESLASAPWHGCRWSWSMTGTEATTVTGIEGITAVVIGSGVTSIGDCAFSQLYGLRSVTISNSVISIGIQAFATSNLLTVTIPDSVTSIGIRAFDRCSSLTDVNYGGSEEQWEQIAIGEYNDPLTSATIHFNS